MSGREGELVLQDIFKAWQGLPGQKEADITEDDIHRLEGPVAYEVAKKACIRKFLHVVEECTRKNEKFVDPEFDLPKDFEKPKDERDCLDGLPITVTEPPDTPKPAEDDDKGPRSVHRVGEIFERPSFAPGARLSNVKELRNEMYEHDSIDIAGFRVLVVLLIGAFLIKVGVCKNILHSVLCGMLTTLLPLLLLVYLWLRRYSMTRTSHPSFSSTVIHQGHIGDCWFLAAVATLSCQKELLERVCVAWDIEKGVYGFVFYRDGSWTYTIVDDFLYLTHGNWNKQPEVQKADVDTITQEKAYKALWQTGSEALCFARCAKTEHVWLPLLEKAYAKVHGDYDAIRAGRSFEGCEDLTGGAGSLIQTVNVLNKDNLWQDLRRKVEDVRLVYTLSSARAEMWQMYHGLATKHAYSIERTHEYYHLDGFRLKKTRLLKLRNPWGVGRGIWRGDWGVGSNKWNFLSSWWLAKNFEEDGVFFITLEDALKTFQIIDRTMIFDERFWNVQQQWAQIDVAKISQYNAVSFQVHLSRSSKVVLSLSRLDWRYFKTLRGPHVFQLHLALRPEGSTGEYMTTATDCSAHQQGSLRSISLETHLEEGTYDVFIRVTAIKRDINQSLGLSASQIVYQNCSPRVDKLRQMAKQYDFAHAKAKRLHKSLSLDPLKYETSCAVGLRVFAQDPELSVEAKCDTEEVNKYFKGRMDEMCQGGDSSQDSDDGGEASGEITDSDEKDSVEDGEAMVLARESQR